nr:hypothetical protein [bacterium]
MRALSISLILITIIVTSSFGGIIDWFGGNFSENGSLSDDAKKLIETAFEGLDRKNIVDCHIHILGVSEEQSGCYANPDMKSFLKSPVKHIKYLIYLSASKSRKNNVDDEYMKRLSDLIEAFNPEGKHLIFAMDKYYEKNGSANNEKTEFYVPNDYVYELSKAKEYFIPVASVHPYRADALDELEKLANKNIRFIKWIPNCMGIDPSDTDIIPFYNVMKKRGMILISHTGNEDAVEAGDNQRFG